MVLVSYEILEDHVIKGSCDFMCKNPSTKVIIQLSFVALETAVLGIKWFKFVTRFGKMIWSKGHITLWAEAQVSHHRSNSRGLRHWASGDEMILVCRMILKDHVTKALKSAITIFPKAHGMSYSHIRNFTITVALTKTFASASSNSSLILVTPSCITNDEIYAKSVTRTKKRKNKKGNCKAFACNANAKSSHINNTQYSLYYVPQSLGNFFRGLLERPKCQIIQFFSGTSHRADSPGGTFMTSNISFHLTEV